MKSIATLKQNSFLNSNLLSRGDRGQSHQKPILFNRSKLLGSLIFVLFMMTAGIAKSQKLEAYLEARGIENLSKAAHASNDFVSGTYDVYYDHVDVTIISKDNMFGARIITELRLIRGAGGLYFSDIKVISDDDFVKPFEAFALQIEFIKEACKAMSQDSYNEMCRKINQTFNTDIEHWTGKMWAILMVNADYYSFLLE